LKIVDWAAAGWAAIIAKPSTQPPTSSDLNPHPRFVTHSSWDQSSPPARRCAAGTRLEHWDVEL
jgi:hypothetical protein